MTYVIIGLGVFILSSCGFMYDDPEEISTSGENYFSSLDASSYSTWVYVKLSTHKSTIVEMSDTDSIPADWDFAIHRYNCKTNGGSVMETEYEKLSELTASGKLPSGEFVSDIMTDSVVVSDISKMMLGELVYQKTNLNVMLSHWMTLDTGSMPPSYTTSNRVYILKLKDNTYAAVRFTDYMNANGTKAYISFDYIYPFSL